MNDNNFDFNDPYLSIFHEQITPISNCLQIQSQKLEIKQNNHINIHQQINQNKLKQQYQQDNSKYSRYQNSKQKKSKIFYRDKMAQLNDDCQYKKQQYNYIDYGKSSRGKSPISRQQQLKRNRQSAKLSRQRKKQYVDLLEQKNKQKDKIIDNLNKKIKILQNQKNKYRQIDNSKKKTFLVTKNEAFEKLSEMTKSCISQDKKIGQYLNQMLNQYGAAGLQRISTINTYFKQIIDIIISDIHKYLINCALNNRGILGSGKWQIIDTQISNIMNINRDKKNMLLGKYGDRFKKQSQTFRDLTQQFQRIFKSIQQQSKIIDNLFNDLKNQFTNRQFASIMVWFQQNKYRKQIKIIKSQWLQCIQDNNEFIDQIRKQSRKSQDIFKI